MGLISRVSSRTYRMDSPEYKRLLTYWFNPHSKITRIEFEKQLRLVLKTSEELQAHNRNMLRILFLSAKQSPPNTNTAIKASSSSSSSSSSFSQVGGKFSKKYQTRQYKNTTAQDH